GVALIAERPADEQKVEFLASKDLWFRPVQLANAPDGTLYLADMYREVIEHPWSLPESIKKLLDLNSGNDRGRIYRIVPDGFKQPKTKLPGKTSTAELVATLENPNGWHRDTAARLLYERQDKAAVAPLVALLEHSKSALGRMHALHALDGLAALNEEIILTALGDSEGIVREHAVLLSEKLFSQGVAAPKLLANLQKLASDSDALVRYQLAFTLGELKGSVKIAPLATIARKDADSSWTQAAILSSLSEGAGELFAELSRDAAFAGSKPGQDFLRQVVVLVGARNKKDEIASVLDFVSKVNQPALSFAMVRGLSEGLQRAGASLADISPIVKPLLASATKYATDEQAPDSIRVAAIQLLSVTTFPEYGKALLTLLDLKEPQAVQLAAVSTLAKFNDPQVGPELTKILNTLTPRVRSEALAALLARPDRARSLLEAIQSGSIRATTLDTTQVKFLKNHRDTSVRQLAAKVLGAATVSSRQQVIDSFMPALNLKGDPAHGKKIYEERCISCHRLGGEGNALGPDLVTVKTTGKEKILVNVLDPNHEVRPEFISYLIETKEEDSLIGLVVNETASSVTLRQAYGKEDVINRSNIRKMQSQGQSLMPEGLEAGLGPQDLADLIEYIEKAEDK
ncbi:MAG TPA: HEAT repeat domain-containing protein, partial [Candidatus Dormibacteraeota bacterium]|nr:HEAT repeat domain-containing protein [Candidatus Dormibacteraeota bacterium]